MNYSIGFHFQLSCYTTNIHMPSSNNKRILISIITICLNEQERIAQTLSSIISQTYPYTELIVIDGASTDDTLKIINEYKQDITHLVSENDNGIYHAMNKGITLAKGDYIIFMNGGDSFFNTNVLSALFNNDDVSEDIIYGNVSYLSPSGNSYIRHHPKNITRLYFTNNGINHQSAFCKTTLFTNLGGFDTKYSVAADYDFFARAILMHNCSRRHFDVTISYFYSDGVSQTGKTKSIMRDERIKIQEEYLPRPFYSFTKCRYWLIDHKNLLFPNIIQKLGNSIFHYFFK